MTGIESSPRGKCRMRSVPRSSYFAREAAATLLRMAKTTKDPTVAAGLVQRAADLKDRTEELPPIDVKAMAEETQADYEELRPPQLAASLFASFPNPLLLALHKALL